MDFQLDHVVHFVNDPKASVDLLKQIGLRAVEGGRHEKWGTYNTLSYFDLSYIEFLGLFDREQAVRSWDVEYDLVGQLVRDSFREGISRIAVRTNRIDQAAEQLKKRGLSVHGPVRGSRRRPDGGVIQWSLLFASDKRSELPLPFIIQWEESDEERRIDLKNRELIAPHPAGDVSISEVAIAVRDLETTADNWASWFGLNTGEIYVDRSLQAKCRSLQLSGGNLLLCSPLANNGVVSEVLATRGERPFLVGLSGGSEKGDKQLLGSIYRFK